MADSRLEREQKRLEMKVPYVEENLYYKSLSTFESKHIKTKQADPRHNKPTKQNSKAVRPNISPR